MSPTKPDSLNPERIKESLAGLTRRHWVAFGATCAERLLPQYVTFHENEGWGDADVLRQGLDTAWQFASGMPVSTEVFRDLERQCRTVMPDTEDFPTLLCSQALDASVAVCETLQLCMGADLTHAVNAAAAARDTVDMFIQERDQMDYADPEFEEKILTDPLMVRELSSQRLVLSELSSCIELSPEFVKSLQLSFIGRSNIR